MAVITNQLTHKRTIQAHFLSPELERLIAGVIAPVSLDGEGVTYKVRFEDQRDDRQNYVGVQAHVEIEIDYSQVAEAAP